MENRFYRKIKRLVIQTPLAVCLIIVITTFSMVYLLTKIEVPIFDEFEGDYSTNQAIHIVVNKEDKPIIDYSNRVYCYENKKDKVTESTILDISETDKQYLIAVQCSEYYPSAKVSLEVNKETLLSRLLKE